MMVSQECSLFDVVNKYSVEMLEILRNYTSQQKIRRLEKV